MMLKAGVSALAAVSVGLVATAPGAPAKTARTCYPPQRRAPGPRNGRTTFADGAIRVGQITGLVLRPNGSLAFIAGTFDDLGAFVAGSQVVAVEHGQAPVVLAGGPGVGPGSLALGGSTVYWTQNAMPFSAQLR